nr:hypothetical protein [Clostridia bacterium]
MNKKTLIIFVLLLIIMSCTLSPLPNNTNNDENYIEDTVIEEKSTLFIKNENEESYVFNTNSKTYLKNNGYTLWTIKYENDESEFEEIEFSVCKESGNIDAGYGLVFCSQELENDSFMLSVMINSNGQYIIGKILNGNFCVISNWQTCNYINRGLGIKNKIKIEFNDETEMFQLIINEKFVTKFSISDNIEFKKSKYGFVVVIANNEHFPNQPVKVTYEK